MDTVSRPVALDVVDYDPREHEPCYIFSPAALNDDGAARPAKRRKTEAQSTKRAPAQSSTEHECHFIPLLEGAEAPGFVRLRELAYTELWSAQEAQIESVLAESNSVTLSEISTFVSKSSLEDDRKKIPTGLVLAGPSISSHGLLFQQIATRVKADTRAPVALLTSGDGVNLKTALKSLIRNVTSQWTGDGDRDADDGVGRHGSRLLNFDLQILHNHMQRRNIQEVVIAFQDSEAFEGGLLSDLISLFSSWSDRIHFILLFGIATSAETFQEKLSSNAVKCLGGEKFDVEPAQESFERLFRVAVGPAARLRPGPSLSRLLLERQKNQSQSGQSLVKALKYAYMTQFYGNPLSVLLHDIAEIQEWQPQHLEALRNLRSFRKYVEACLSRDDVKSARALLEDDEFLIETTLLEKSRLRAAIPHVLDAVDILEAAYTSLSRSEVTYSALYVKAVSGELQDSPILRDLLLSVKKMPSDSLSTLLEKIGQLTLQDPKLQDDLLPLEEALAALVQSQLSTTATPLRSADDIHHTTLRATVVAQKVSLSTQKSTLSAEESAYSRLVTRVHDTLAAYFTRSLVRPQDFYLHEIFFYDLRSPHRDVFSPKPRFAIERALSAPHDYLGCSCCESSPDGEGDGLSATHPHTAILYQLYLESGGLINAYDFWNAFRTIVGGEDGEDCDERNALALFYRALADLKFMGMIKHSRKKTDHLAKLAWKGL